MKRQMKELEGTTFDVKYTDGKNFIGTMDGLPLVFTLQDGILSLSMENFEQVTGHSIHPDACQILTQIARPAIDEAIFKHNLTNGFSKN